MKAILLKDFGGRENLYLGETERPTPKANQLLVKVKTTALNRADIMQREGKYPPPPGESEILGLEIAGVVESVGANCTKFKEGDKVFALLAGGGYAEYAVVDERSAMSIPSNLSFEEAGAIAEVFLTAFQALHHIADLQKGETALIHAGASGVGTAAIQLAKLQGATPVVTAGSAEKIAFCESLGAAWGINYKEQPNFDKIILEKTGKKGANVIIDFIGGSYFERNLNLIAPDGRWVILAFMGGMFPEKVNLAQVLMKRVRIQGSTLRARSLDYKAQLTQAFSEQKLPHFETGQLKPIVDKVYNWEDVAEAHAYMESNQSIGKIVLRVGE